MAYDNDDGPSRDQDQDSASTNGGRIGNSRRRGQTRVLTLCKYAVTTLVRGTVSSDVDGTRLSEKLDILS